MTPRGDTTTASTTVDATIRVDPSPTTSTALTSIAWVGLLPGIFGLILFAIRGGPLLLGFALPSMFAIVTLFILRARAAMGWGKVTIEGGRTTLVGEARTVSFPIADVVSGVRTTGGSGVRLELRDGRSVVLGTSAEEADALLRATGTSVLQRALPIRLRGAIGPFVAGLLYSILGLFVVAGGVNLARRLGAPAMHPGWITIVGAMFSITFAVAMVATRRPRLVIGLDGLRIKRGFREKFVPYDEILQVSVTSGREPAFSVRSRGNVVDFLPVEGMDADAIARAKLRIDEAIEARSAASAQPVDAFARRGRSVSAWREDLRRALSNEGGYRSARLTEASAEAVLQDPTAPVDARVGAALALRVVGAPKRIERTRSAATASADEAARRALEAAAEEEDAAIEEALATLPAARSLGRDV